MSDLSRGSGERQLKKSYSEVAPNHLERYRWALRNLNKILEHKLNPYILDAAAGVGYGSKLFASNAFLVHAVDYSSEAYEYYKKYWNHPNIKFTVDDILEFNADYYDAVISLETLEHLSNVNDWIGRVNSITKIFIGTVPNQSVVPFNKKRWPFHYRHFTKSELEIILIGNGWNIVKWCTQYDKWDKEKAKMRPGDNGMTLGFVATRS